MADDLSPTDYAFLLLLRVEDRELSNNELHDLHGVRLIGAQYAKLNAGGYVVSKTDRRPYRHALSPKGARLLDSPLEVEEEQQDSRKTKETQLWAALTAWHRHTLGRGPAPAPGEKAAPVVSSLDERIRAAYATLADDPGDWVSLSRLRPLFPDVAKADLDQALKHLLDASDVRLDPEVHGHRIDAEERAASVRIGGEDRHKLAIGSR
ncbi:hypothetical protein [Symbioplanes lichenis]|uniref:hypothetical protein n=1 Tax=Symbioplanes lichenis TaxID=1629072 RepID=UPI0027392D8C|nr:hypothetical protein [Actinoplanes lichenis]